MVINTTRGPVEVDPTRRNPAHIVNTSDILEPPQMQYVDEPPEVAHVLNAAGWAAVFEDGRKEPLVFWVVEDTSEVYGVSVGPDGRIDLTDSVEGLDGFSGYEQGTETKEETR